MDLLYARVLGWLSITLDGAAYFIIAMVGAFVKDIYDTYSGTRPRIEIYRIFVSTTLSTFLTFAARDYVGENSLPAVNFVLGVIGWELFSRVSTIDGLVKTIKDGRQLLLTLFVGNGKVPPSGVPQVGQTGVPPQQRQPMTATQTAAIAAGQQQPQKPVQPTSGPVVEQPRQVAHLSPVGLPAMKTVIIREDDGDKK